MARQGERGWPVSILVMTTRAPVEVGRCGKLATMDILVAVRAKRKLDFVKRCWPLGNMALSAGHLRMRAVQRETAGVVVYHCEFRRLKAIQSVAGVAPAAIRAPDKLSIMGIRVMAVGARLMRNRRLEVSGLMADPAVNL